MAADTIREQIISAYMARLTSWSEFNGFNYNCGASVHRAIKIIDEKDLPACVLWPQAEQVTQQYGLNFCEMIFKVEALSLIESDINPSIIQEKLLGDVIKIMTNPAIVVTSLVEDIVYTGGGPAGIANPEEQITAIYAEFKIKYQTLIGNPYSQ